MRKFYIENEKNERFSLWGNRVYMVNPSGLGVKHDAKYIRIGNTFLRNKSNLAQSKIGGKIEFVDPGANKRFMEFYDFCAAASALRLVYDPGEGKEYIRDIDIAEVKKTEKTGATLPITVSFACKSLYYLRDNNRFMFENAENEKRYDYRYDYAYGEYGTYAITFNNDGHAESPFECIINGHCVNPSIRIEKDGATLHEVVFPVVVEEGEFVRYSSLDGRLEAVHVSGGGEVNLMSYLDIQNDNFFKIPLGKSTIVPKAKAQTLFWQQFTKCLRLCENAMLFCFKKRFYSP